jgi:hypothetical protein
LIIIGRSDAGISAALRAKECNPSRVKGHGPQRLLSISSRMGFRRSTSLGNPVEDGKRG